MLRVPHGFSEVFTQSVCGTFSEMVCPFACITAPYRAFCADAFADGLCSRASLARFNVCVQRRFRRRRFDDDCRSRSRGTTATERTAHLGTRSALWSWILELQDQRDLVADRRGSNTRGWMPTEWPDASSTGGFTVVLEVNTAGDQLMVTHAARTVVYAPTEPTDADLCD